MDKCLRCGVVTLGSTLSRNCEGCDRRSVREAIEGEQTPDYVAGFTDAGNRTIAVLDRLLEEVDPTTTDRQMHIHDTLVRVKSELRRLIPQDGNEYNRGRVEERNAVLNWLRQDSEGPHRNAQHTRMIIFELVQGEHHKKEKDREPRTDQQPSATDPPAPTKRSRR